MLILEEYILDNKRGRYAPKEENVRKLFAFLKKEEQQNDHNKVIHKEKTNN